MASSLQTLIQQPAPCLAARWAATYMSLPCSRADIDSLRPFDDTAAAASVAGSGGAVYASLPSWQFLGRGKSGQSFGRGSGAAGGIATPRGPLDDLKERDDSAAGCGIDFSGGLLVGGVENFVD